jgi:hypothetical protein
MSAYTLRCRHVCKLLHQVADAFCPEIFCPGAALTRYKILLINCNEKKVYIPGPQSLFSLHPGGLVQMLFLH